MSAERRREAIERAATEVFAERGYRSASVDEIVRRAGCTPPVLYDHFASKQDLYLHLVERHYGELREVWYQYFVGDAPIGDRLPLAIDAWFAYVETHPFAGRMMADASGDPELLDLQRVIEQASRAQLLPLVAAETDTDQLEFADEYDVEMIWEVLRGVLQGLALWWQRHPDVARGRVVAVAMNSLWVGFDRFFRGQRWQGTNGAP